MNENTSDLKKQLRDAEGQAKVATAAVADGKRGRLKSLVWAGIGGALLVIVGGQWFPGYKLDSTANEESRASAQAAVSDVMAALCAERFMRPPGLEERMAGLNAESGDWSQAAYIRNGAWASAPDGTKPDHSTAEKCRGMIAERANGEAAKAS